MNTQEKSGWRSPPSLAVFLYALTLPKADEVEQVAELIDLYQTYAVPTYGRLAPLWAYWQALRALRHVMPHRVWHVLTVVWRLIGG